MLSEDEYMVKMHEFSVVLILVVLEDAIGEISVGEQI